MPQKNKFKIGDRVRRIENEMTQSFALLFGKVMAGSALTEMMTAGHEGVVTMLPGSKGYKEKYPDDSVVPGFQYEDDKGRFWWSHQEDYEVIKTKNAKK